MTQQSPAALRRIASLVEGVAVLTILSAVAVATVVSVAVMATHWQGVLQFLLGS